MEREKFSSRLGFLLISAGCAIGLGNVWRFPYITGQYGGAAFVLIYLFFLIIMGLPIMAMEFAVGRASQKSCAASFRVLEPKGTKWHLNGYFGMLGNYLLMMFYTTIGGWMLSYFFKMVKGDFVGLDAQGVSDAYKTMLSKPVPMFFWMVVIVVFSFWVCSKGLRKGVERINKFMMTCLLLIMVALTVALGGAGGSVTAVALVGCIAGVLTVSLTLHIPLTVALAVAIALTISVAAALIVCFAVAGVVDPVVQLVHAQSFDLLDGHLRIVGLQLKEGAVFADRQSGVMGLLRELGVSGGTVYILTGTAGQGSDGGEHLLVVLRIVRDNGHLYLGAVAQIRRHGGAVHQLFDGVGVA